MKLNGGIKSFFYVSLLALVLGVTISKIKFLRERFVLPTNFDYTWIYPHQWNSITLHLAIWSASIEAIKERPIFGYGTGKGQNALEEVYKKKGFVRALAESYNAHNEFFSASLDVGIIGGLFLAAMIFFTFMEGLRSKEIMLISFVVVYTLFFCVESILLRQKAIFFFSFFYTILFGCLPKSKN